MSLRWQRAEQRSTLPAEYRSMWGSRTLPGAMVLGAADAGTLNNAVPEVLDALLSLPRQVYGGDDLRFAEDLGLEGDRLNFLMGVADMPMERYGRADLYATADGWKLLEFNVASDLGGVDRSVASTAATQAYPNVHALDTVAMLGRVLRERSERFGRPVASVGIVVGSDCPLGLIKMLLSLRSALRSAMGVRVEIEMLATLDIDDHRVIGPHGPIDVILRYFTVEHALSSADGIYVQALVRSARAGGCVLWTSPNSSLFSNKAAMVLLAEALQAEQLSLSSEARSLVVPASRADRRPATSFTDSVDWILKDTTSAAGGGTICAWETDPDTWLRCLADGGPTAVVQQRVTPAAVDVDGYAYNVVIGMFIIDGRPAGFDARCAPVGSGDVIGWSSNPKTMVAPVIVEESV